MQHRVSPKLCIIKKLENHIPHKLPSITEHYTHKNSPLNYSVKGVIR